MEKHCLYWKPVVCKDIREQDYQCDLPDLLSLTYRGRLVAEILQMPRGNPIFFEDAIRLVHEKNKEALRKCDADKRVWYQRNFIQYISEAGYHIELTGDEFVFHLCSARAS